MAAKRKRRIKVGDRVTFLIGTRRLSGLIIEDRGCIGYKRRRLFSIRAKLYGDEESVFDLPEEELRVTRRAA